MPTPVSSSLTPLNAEVFIQEGYELSLDSIVPSIILTGSYSTTTSYTQFFIYDFAKNIVSQNLDYNLNGSYLTPGHNTSISNSSSSYNQFEINPSEDVYNQGFSSGNYYALYNFIDYELGSKTETTETNPEQYNGHPYFIKNISGDRTELRIQNNFLTSNQIESYYNKFSNKINARENADEFYISFEGNRNFIGVNSQLELSLSGSSNPTSILLKLYKPLPLEFETEQELQIISKVGETQVYSVNFTTNLEFVDNLLQLKGPNYNVDLKDRINNSTNFKTLDDLINTNSSQSYYQFNSLNDQKGVAIRKNWGDWNEFVKYSSAEQRLNNFKSKLSSIETYEDSLASLENIGGTTPGTPDYSSSYNNISNNINQIISKFDSYEYFLYYITGSESWPKYTTTYPYTNFSITSSEALNWFGSTDESSPYFNTGKNQIYSASRYDENNQDYLYYLIPPFITNNSNNDQYVKFVNMTGQSFDEMFLYTEAVEQVRNTNSSLTGSVLPLGLADEVIESLGFDVGGNSFNSIDFNPNSIGVYPTANSGLEYIDRYIDIASGSIINYYDTQQSTLGYVIALADPSFPYPLDNSTQEIYKRIFHNMISLVKRKGTVTGLRQLINIWGVPNTMLRISEFGGKNKDDENDYDLWMNRYSNAMSTIPISESISSTTKPSGSIRIPWQPLTSNYVDGNAPSSYYSVPDCIQFRFKPKQPTSATAQFSQSLLVKGNLYNGTADFALTLAYSGSQSGSFSGSVLPNDNQYGSLVFHLSGSAPEGGILSTPPISLPFFDKGWWSVQLQRSENLAYTNDGGPAYTNYYELKVANNIYDGYDGNQIGFMATSSFDITDISPSHNMAWNDIHGVVTLSPSGNSFAKGYSAVALGGMMDGGVNNENTFIGSGTNVPGLNNRINIGEGFLGDFQEFRFYRRAMSSSQFNDYVMNPESIQGHADSNTGAGSSYDLLSFRLPLGNELEYTEVSGSANDVDWNNAQGGQVKFLSFGGNSFFSGKNAFGSLHPSLVNKQGSLFTSSFITTNNITSSQYGIAYQGRTGAYTSAITSSYLEPNTEINYMDQPSAGIRNRIKNKIQVIDGNEYGTILSPFRSIQQEFEQSGSYTEDLNSLEVGFSFQNEINDDIIATFGHGVVSDAVADPRFISESSDRYPELTRIAEDYFKKYQGTAITDPTYNGGLPTIIEKEYDYNRLIKFYETSLFKAIKNYVPARTSLSTGIIVKQHLLERNKATTVPGININTPIAKTPETGSDVYGYTDQTGFNSVISQRNLLITSSIPVGSLTGSAGGSVNKYNIITNEGQFYKNVSGASKVLSAGNINNLYDTLPPANPALNIKIATALDSEEKVFQQSEVAFRSQLRWKPSFGSTPSTPTSIRLEATSSKRGGIFSTEFPYGTSTSTPPAQVSNNFIEIYPDERIYWRIGSTNVIPIVMTDYVFQFGEAVEFTKPEPLSSQQVNWYIDDFTGEYKVDDHQTEFYDGEFSGSNFEVIPPQYNPYRIFLDGNNITPDTLGGSNGEPPVPIVNFNNGGAEDGSIDVTWTVVNDTKITVTAGTAQTSQYVYYTGSISGLVAGQEYEMEVTYTNSTFVIAGMLFMGFNRNAFLTTEIMWPPIDPHGATITFNNFRNYVENFTSWTDSTSFIFNPNKGGPPFNDAANNVIAFFFDSSAVGRTVTIEVNYIRPIGINQKHFYPGDAFTIAPSQSQLFQNSPYNPTINNVSGSRESSFYYDMDFDPVNPGSELKEGIPSDYTLLVSSSQLGWEEANPTADNLLEYAEVPDSNYTTKAIINPRYNGSKITSADYNFRITEASLSESQEPSGLFSPLMTSDLKLQSKIRFLNGDTGSWGGDKSSKYVSAIDNRPIYFAHFKSSYENFEKFGTSTFEIDQLIQIPFESIQGEQEPIITSSQLTGNNENLIPVASTFVPQRKLKTVYNQASKQFRNLKSFLTPSISEVTSPTLNYNDLTNVSKYINTPAQDLVSTFTNQKSPFTLLLTQSFNAPNWTETNVNYGKGEGQNNTMWVIQGTDNQNPLNTDFNAISQSIGPNPLFSDNSSLLLFQTGSSPSSNNKGYGLLYVMGQATKARDMYQYNFENSAAIIELDINGPHLQLINSANHNINNGNIAYTSSTQQWRSAPNATNNPNLVFGSPDNVTAMWGAGEADNYFPWPWCASTSVTDPFGASPDRATSIPTLPIRGDGTRGIENYFTYNYSQSAVDEYVDKNLPVMIERGDRIRVTYASPSSILNPNISPVDFNKLKNNELITAEFTVVGYELPPPVVVIKQGYPYNGTTQLGWATGYPGTGTTGNTFYADIISLPPTGLYSPDSLKERYDLIIENGQPLLFITDDSNDAKAFTGSLSNCEIMSRWGEESGSSGIIAPTGSIRLTLQGWGSDIPINERGLLGTTQALLKTGMEMGFNTPGNPITASWEGFDPKTSAIPISPSEFSSIVIDSSTYFPLDPGFMYDTLIVSPDPTTLPKPILSGSIAAATIVKSINDDTKVIVDMTQPINQKGAKTPSGDGYLIPDDLSPTQQDNVQKIINVLKSKNSFTNPPDANETKDVS